MKKFLCALLAFGMALGAVACGGNNGNGDNGQSSGLSGSVESSSQSESVSESVSESESNEESWEEFIPDFTSTTDVLEYFSGQTGNVTYNTGKDLTIETLYIDAPIYLGERNENNVFTIDGGEDFERTLTMQGSGGGVVQANGGILIIKNMIIRNDTHPFNDNYYRDYYAEFGGKVRFENCTLECAVQLRNDAQAEFINCKIKSLKEDEYGVWLADGSARFDGCTFTGYRALKVHEINGMDVVNLSVENCFFEDISKKPAIAIDIDQELSTTTISFVNCDIYNCASYKRVPQETVNGRTENVVGEDGFYERVIYSDDFPGTFTFTATDCYLDGAFFSFINGEMIYQLD